MTLTEVIKKQEKEFSSFNVKIGMDCDNRTERIVFLDNKEFVGDVLLESQNEFDNVKKLYVSTNYRNQGYSKFMLKYALEYSKNKGKEGIVVGNPLDQRTFTQNTYNNFRNYEIQKDEKSKVTVLTDWMHSN
jgi:GNAT superfamily N-acetyltransferase